MLDLLLKVTLLILSRVATNIATTPMMQIKGQYCNQTLFIDDRTLLTLVTGLFPALQNEPENIRSNFTIQRRISIVPKEKILILKAKRYGH